MKAILPEYHISPLGDSALLIDFGNRIDEDINRYVLARTDQLRQYLVDLIEVVPAYSSISIFFDLVKWRKKTPKEKLVFDHIKEKTEYLLSQPFQQQHTTARTLKIPVCYEPEFARDIHAVAERNNMPAEEVISLHLSRPYRVYMLGFLPGFCYLGETDANISAPRKIQPVPVAPGAVGIAGKQTGIYPMASPGGWQIIGRTPLKLFDAGAEESTLFRAGDSVHLFPISSKDFFEIQNSNTPFRMME